ncbi:hypothetical protein B0H19DRAFT_1264764 [Mycena capillaripes]|nr:hypothetical protein B0H19DRAFT_1264764 [Mycena capillaripes]
MPKAKASTAHQNPQEPLLVLTDGRKRVLILRPKTYKAAVETAHRHFPSIKTMDMVFQTSQLAICQEEMTDISPESWDAVVHLVSSVMRGGKPVIYLYSPTETTVSVALTLTREWNFSAIYPVVPTKPSPSGTGERIQWNVCTHLDGSLTELNTGLDVTYLFWEAHINHGIPPSPPASPALAHFNTAQSFSPLTSDLSPADSVLIAVHDITPYLDKVLLALGPHTEARTSFITFVFFSFSKPSHTHVALRFVPQAAYETTAALDIQPVPDVVTRIFMLFKGVDDGALGEWKEAKPTAGDAERWRRVVGGDFHRALNAALFRVLEWGGMEVLAR